MKKILAVMLCLVMVLGVFTGCGDKKDNATAEIEVIRLQELLTKEVVYEYFRTKYEEDNTYIPDDVRRMFKLMNNMGV